MKKLTTFETPDEAADLGTRVGKTILGLQKQEGMLLVKVLDRGFTVIPPNIARRRTIEECERYVARTYALVKQFGVEADLIRAFFNAEKQGFLAEAQRWAKELDISDVHQARNTVPRSIPVLTFIPSQDVDGFWISKSDQERANILNRC
jgi:hypothetical protein